MKIAIILATGWIIAVFIFLCFLRIKDRFHRRREIGSHQDLVPDVPIEMETRVKTIPYFTDKPSPRLIIESERPGSFL